MKNFIRFVRNVFKRKPLRPFIAALLLVLAIHFGEISLLSSWIGNTAARWTFVLIAVGLLAYTFYSYSESMRRAATATSDHEAAIVGSVMDRPGMLFAILKELRAAPGPQTSALQLIDKITGALAERSAKLDDSRPIYASIIVPVFNEIAYTIVCLYSLLEHATRYRFEVLIGDDCSTDATSDVIRRIGSVVRFVRHTQNRGFLRNCNETAKRAQGKYLVFLNNDTFVLDGWLDGLIGPFERFANTGLVGSRLLSADGRLQEAGGIVLNDGSTWNYGRNNDPEAPEFNYLKDVDYCSGCSIAVRHDLWSELGGFDERFSPAYYEDVDLAFALRARGYRTLYSPESKLIHHEGISHGTDLAAGIKAYQIQNQKKFTEKWHAVLMAEHYANHEQVLRLRDRSREEPFDLVVEQKVQNGTSLVPFDPKFQAMQFGWRKTAAGWYMAERAAGVEAISGFEDNDAFELTISVGCDSSILLPPVFLEVYVAGAYVGYIAFDGEENQSKTFFVPAGLATKGSRFRVTLLDRGGPSQWVKLMGIEFKASSNPSIRDELRIFVNSQVNDKALLVEGWSSLESWGVWNDGDEAMLRLPRPAGKEAFNVDMDVVAFGYSPRRLIEQRIEVEFEGRTILRENVKAGERKLRLTVPASSNVNATSAVVKFKFPDACATAELPNTWDRRKLALGIKSMLVIGSR